MRREHFLEVEDSNQAGARPGDSVLSGAAAERLIHCGHGLESRHQGRVWMRPSRFSPWMATTIGGSAQLELAETPGLDSAVHTSLADYLAVMAWAGGDDSLEESDARLAGMIPDAARRRLLLTLVMQLAPRSRGAVDSVELTGRAVKASRSVRLTRGARERLAAALVTKKLASLGRRPLRRRDPR